MNRRPWSYSSSAVQYRRVFLPPFCTTLSCFALSEAIPSSSWQPQYTHDIGQNILKASRMYQLFNRPCLLNSLPIEEAKELNHYPKTGLSLSRKILRQSWTKYVGTPLSYLKGWIEPPLPHTMLDLRPNTVVFNIVRGVGGWGGGCGCSTPRYRYF